MFGKRKKKLDRKMRRRIRKTSAVMLLISAITVAAIPVPEAAAEEGNEIATYAVNPESEKLPAENEKKFHVGAEAPESSSDPSTGNGIIPWVDGTQKIYTSPDERYKFAYMQLVNGGWKAILLQCDRVDTDFVIPSTLKAYMQYAVNIDQGNVAANQEGKALYYKVITPVVFERVYKPTLSDNDPAPTTPPSGSDNVPWSGLQLLPSESGTESVYSGGVEPPVQVYDPPQWDNARRAWVQKVNFYTYRYEPCLQKNESIWDNKEWTNGIVHYTFDENNASGISESTKFYRIPTDQSFTNWKIDVNTITAVLGSGYVDDGEGEGKGCFEAKNKTDDWLTSAEVAYISDQTVIEEGKVWKAGPTRGTTSFIRGQRIKNLTIPDSMIAIADYSFYGCTSLERVVLGESSNLEAVGSYAFANCTVMEAFSLASNSPLQVISDHMFDNCQKLAGFTVPNGTTMIADAAFKGCSALSMVDFSNAGILTEIGNNVFESCNSLREVSMPSKLNKMGWYNFKDCRNLEKVILDEDVGNEPETLRFNNFAGCGNLKCIDVKGNGTTFNVDPALAYNAETFKEEVHEDFYFIGNSGNVAIHDVTKNNAIAFMYRNDNPDVPTIYEKIIRMGKDSEGKDIEITYQVDSNNELVQLNIEGKPEEIVIEGKIGPHKVEKIGSEFSSSSTTKLESITIPATIKEIGENAFKGCSSLKEVYFSEPNNILYSVAEDGTVTNGIGKNAFQTESDLKFYGDIRAGSAPFEYAMDPANTTYSRREVYIDFCSGAPANLHVHYDPERGNSTLWKVPVTPRLEALMKGAYDSDDPAVGSPDNLGVSQEYVDHLWKVLERKGSTDIPSDIVALIQSYRDTGRVGNGYNNDTDVRDAVAAAFDITIPSGVKSIAEDLFSRADAESTKKTSRNELSGMNFDENAVYGMYPNKDEDKTGPNFVANNDIRSITMYNIEKLDPYAFYGCENLNTVQMCSSDAANGENIGDYAFGQCEKLVNVALPNTTGAMGNRPFAGDTLLENVHFVGETPVSAGEIANLSANGEKYQCERSVIYEKKNGEKDSIVECLESRGNSGSTSRAIGDSELRGINSIKDEAFMNCDGLATVDLSTSNVKTIPQFCFDNAEKLAYLMLPDTCESVGRYALKDTALSIMELSHPSTRFENNSLYDTEERGHLVNGVEVKCVPGSYVENWVLESPNLSLSADPIVPKFTISYYDSRTEDGTGEWIDDEEVDANTVKLNGPDEEKMAEILKKHEGKELLGWSPSIDTPVWENQKVAAVYGDEKPQQCKITFMNVNKVHWETTLPSGPNSYIPFVEDPVSPYGSSEFKFIKWSPEGDYKINDPVTSDRTFWAEYEFIGSGTTSGNDPNDPNNPNNPNNPNDPNNPNGGNNGNNTTSGNNANGTLYTLTVVNGSGSGSYAAGTQVTVAAYTPNTGYAFNNWTSSESDTDFTSKTLAATSFKMPAKNLTVTANYITKSETGSNITSKLTPGTVTSAPASNTGSVNRVDSSSGSNGNGGSSVQVNRPGISNGDVASATVNGSTDNFVVKVTEDGHATAAVAEALRNEYGSLDNIRYFAMDISLYDETGTRKVADTSGLSVTMTLPIPDELRQYAGNNKVGAVTGGNNLDKLNARFTTVNGVPCVTFTATHFSPYTVYVDTANLSAGGYDATPKTGDAIHPKWFLAIGLALFSAVLFLKKDKKVSYNAV